MANLYGDAVLLQIVGGLAPVHIRAGDGDAHALEHHAQSAHGNAANAHQMGPLSGDQVFCNMRSLFMTHDRVPPQVDAPEDA